MSRVIKFRAWDVERKEMMEPNYFGIDEYITPEGDVVEKETHSGIGFSDMYMVDISDKRILMQFTGLHDKNGQEIYEGDICSTDLSRPYNIVVFRNGAFVYQCNDHDEDYYDIMVPIYETTDRDEYTEVIGNIYEHPHMLESNKK